MLLILAYAKNNQQPPEALCDWFCLNPDRRILLYDEFVKIGKQSLFTGQYASQSSFAQAFTTIFTNAEVGESTTKYYDLVVIKDAILNGKMARFYIFKITCQFRRSTEIFTAITGPFSTNANNFSITEGKEIYILYRKPFEEKNVDILFADFIKKVNQIK